MRKIATLLLIPFTILSVRAQQTTGLFQYDWPTQDGYVVWGPIFGYDQYVMNNCGEVVHTWHGDGVTLGNSFYLKDDGTMIRCAKADTAVNHVIQAGGGGERIQEVQWDGSVTWDYIYYTQNERLHHDIEVLPNGNVLAIVWELMDEAACLQAGCDPGRLAHGFLLNEKIIEVHPTGSTTGDIVWQWRLWDHLVQDFDNTKDNYGVVTDHPELLDVNYLNMEMDVPGQSDFIHMNAVDYNADLDQILMSSQVLSEIWIIDHATTTTEAAGHSGGTRGKGGDFLYRYGNPQVYDRGSAQDQKLWRQHDAHWIPDDLQDGGSIMIFNNGLDRQVSFSEIDVITPPQVSAGVYELVSGQAYGPETKTWNYHAPDSVSFYSYFISGARRQPNGNTIICEGEKGRIFEVTYDGEKVWEYVNPVTFNGIISSTDPIPLAGGGAFQGNLVFRAPRYAADFPGFSGRDLSSGTQLEANPFMTGCIVGVDDLDPIVDWNVYPNPTEGNVTLQGLDGATVSIYDVSGRLVRSFTCNSNVMQIDLSSERPGLYALCVEQAAERFVRKIILN
ncbi:MAG: T9SS type A sorting domain-containing protein [Flavobacteriales bacterium]|nr:T9SS type A sorting domain-containing protein [Flavobacteriales bacterium]